MLIKVGYEMTYNCPAATPMLLMVDLHFSHAYEIVRQEPLTVTPAVAMSAYRDSFGNYCRRLEAPPGRTTFSTSAVVRSDGSVDPIALDARQHPIPELPDDVLLYLMPSRYCDSDLLTDFAWKQFGLQPLGWLRVQAICDFVHNHIRFDYTQARATRTAMEAFTERVGVCRDYAHLAIALCRCLNIPARYCTGYLGDIGVPPPYGPMDFAGWFEAYLGGDWHVFDPRNNVPRIGRVLIARGRDAVDVAISTTFGPNVLERFVVVCEEVENAE